MIFHLDENTDYVIKNELSFTEGLLRLSSKEVDFKEINIVKSMVKVGAFPNQKELNDFDFEFQPSLNKQQILELSNLGFLENNENIVFLGNSGVGKTHLATALGIAVAKQPILLNAMI